MVSQELWLHPCNSSVAVLYNLYYIYICIIFKQYHMTGPDWIIRSTGKIGVLAVRASVQLWLWVEIYNECCPLITF